MPNREPQQPPQTWMVFTKEGYVGTVRAKDWDEAFDLAACRYNEGSEDHVWVDRADEH